MSVGSCLCLCAGMYMCIFCMCSCAFVYLCVQTCVHTCMPLCTCTYVNRLTHVSSAELLLALANHFCFEAKNRSDNTHSCAKDIPLPTTDMDAEIYMNSRDFL